MGLNLISHVHSSVLQQGLNEERKFEERKFEAKKIYLPWMSLFVPSLENP